MQKSQAETNHDLEVLRMIQEQNNRLEKHPEDQLTIAQIYYSYPEEILNPESICISDAIHLIETRNTL